MDIFGKFKETFFSVFPVMAAVLLLNFTIVPMQTAVVLKFVASGFLVIAGLTLFLSGVDMGITPMGERAGAALTAKKSIALLLSCAFVIGVFVTIAEPDVQVLVDQVKSVASYINKWLLIVMIALGVGLFVALGILRTMLAIPLKIFLAVSYIFLFVLEFFTVGELQGISFDSGGATTGPMTVPFIMALGLGVAAVRSKGSRGSRSKNKKNAADGNIASQSIGASESSEEESSSSEDDSFGLTGIASIGPVVAVCLYGILFSSLKDSGGGVAMQFEDTGNLVVSVIKEVVFALSPLVFLFLVFQLFLLHMPRMQVVKTVRGVVFSFVGLVIFLCGAKYGFIETGYILGRDLGYNAVDGTTFNVAQCVILLCVSLLFGGITVCAEPAVWILTEQVENVSGGTIKRKLLVFALALGVAVSIALSVVRILFGFSIFYILIPGYALALLLTIFCPKLFTGIAFDSGGVASGPMTSTFILSFAIGVANGISRNASAQDSFGVISLVAMTPLIAIQILGIIFKLKQKGKIK